MFAAVTSKIAGGLSTTAVKTFVSAGYIPHVQLWASILSLGKNKICAQ
jgi:hypothetical protein